ncbi:hypothetical protein GPECTOR_415g265 [Gonium pectorale]|uniref:Uncharacterized protein n=1 Tax=Gonium pectorale TaxID=33097 RepID=A0A150FV75_GONPE|nr:hypothetical protein GPECTOR_415g265 [Gonium pectorale]|eukprot:KXZ41521.1 hypothetical protein GPECTOR_415g265 [Gonium pectorale]
MLGDRLTLAVADGSDAMVLLSGTSSSSGRMTVRCSEEEARRTGHLYRVHPGGALR